jgi:hypothetical protein
VQSARESGIVDRPTSRKRREKWGTPTILSLRFCESSADVGHPARVKRGQTVSAVFRSTLKEKPALYFPVKVAHAANQQSWRSIVDEPPDT